MGKTYPKIDDRLAEFIRSQHVFFVATAPLSGEGHINLSPKGLDTFTILDPETVAYLDLTGSGIETVAHLRENGRIVIMFCAFAGAPKILRLYGRGEVVEPGQAGFDGLRRRFPHYDGVRSVVRVSVDRIADSCGFGVPLMAYEADRDTLGRWVASKGEESLAAYRLEHNARSLDELPGLSEASPG